MRTALIAVVAAACGSPRADGDAGAHDGDAMSSDAGQEPYCGPPPTFADGRTPTRVLHVSPGATGGDGSMGAPFGTIEAAAAVATPGTFIQLAAGMHESGQYVANLRGTPQAPIWIGGAAGTMPVIEGGAEAIHLTRPAYVVVQNLEIRGQTANGINIDDGGDYADEAAAHHVAVIGVDVHDVGGGGNQDCLKVSGVNDLFVYDSRFARCGGAGSGSGIDHVGCHRSVIARNVFEAMSGNAVQAKGGSTDIDVRQNRIHDGGARAVNLGGSTGLEYFRPPLSTSTPNAEARRVRVVNNVFTGDMDTPFAFVGCVDCLAAHNLVFGSPRWLLRILQETITQSGYTFEPARGGRIINNSFVWNDAALATHVNVGANTEPASFTFAHNLWYAIDDPSQSMPSLPVAEAGAVTGMYTGYEAYPLGEDIPFYECPAAEMHRGTPLADVPGDFHGHCRNPLSPPTIGPLQMGSCTI